MSAGPGAASTERTAYLGIGSNLSPETHILKAIVEIRAQMQVMAASRFYRNPAHQPDGDAASQPDFVNGVLEVRTSRDPQELKFGVLREIERRIGRKRTADRYAPRVLDLDLLIYGEVRMETETLVLPDPEIFRRAFWAVPLSELVPDFPGPGPALSLKLLVHRMDTRSLKYEETLTRAVREAIGYPSVPGPGKSSASAG